MTPRPYACAALRNKGSTAGLDQVAIVGMHRRQRTVLVQQPRQLAFIRANVQHDEHGRAERAWQPGAQGPDCLDASLRGTHDNDRQRHRQLNAGPYENGAGFASRSSGGTCLSCCVRQVAQLQNTVTVDLQVAANGIHQFP